MIPSLEESTGVRVLVAAADAARAEEILEDYQAEEGDADAGGDEDEDDDEGE